MTGHKASVRTYWLSMHVPYACAHSGACCTSGWPIAVERVRVAPIQALRADGSWLLPAPGAPPDVAGVVATTSTGACVFHRSGCDIQRAHGHAALPAACQHFPRELLIDPRGVFVSLSHYCPTAAELLFTHHDTVEIVEGPPALPEGTPEGLDAREVLPPLLTRGVLMDHAGYSAWEAHMVRVLTSPDALTPDETLAVLGRDAAELRTWRPGGITLADAVARLAAGATLASTTLSGGRPRPSNRRDGTVGPVIRRWLAARAFASWAAYQGGGLAGVLEHLHAALDELRRQLGSRHAPESTELKEAIRRADLQLLHLTPRP